MVTMVFWAYFWVFLGKSMDPCTWFKNNFPSHWSVLGKALLIAAKAQGADED
jgi:hypothetical protein